MLPSSPTRPSTSPKTRGPGGKSARRDRDESDAPVVKLVQPDHPGSGHPAGQRHPHRAVRRPRPRPLPDRRRAGRARQSAAPPARPHASAASRSWGRSTSPRSAGRRTAGSRCTVAGKHYRPARQHPADHARPVVRHAHPRPRQHPGRASRTWASRDDDYRAVPEHHQTAQRHLPGDRADRFRQDDHALRRPERAEPARSQDHHGRGSGRVLPARHQPGAR